MAVAGLIKKLLLRKGKKTLQCACYNFETKSGSKLLMVDVIYHAGRGACAKKCRRGERGSKISGARRREEHVVGVGGGGGDKSRSRRRRTPRRAIKSRGARGALASAARSVAVRPSLLIRHGFLGSVYSLRIWPCSNRWQNFSEYLNSHAWNNKYK